MGPGLVTAVRGIYAELQMSKRGKVLKIEKDSSNALAVHFILIIVYIQFSKIFQLPILEGIDLKTNFSFVIG